MKPLREAACKGILIKNPANGISPACRVFAIISHFYGFGKMSVFGVQN
jgi:hypothetical protein